MYGHQRVMYTRGTFKMENAPKGFHKLLWLSDFAACKQTASPEI
jgi:hypothetical protein